MSVKHIRWLGILVILCGVGIIILSTFSTTLVYSGKIAFNSESEYVQFKTELAQDYVSYRPTDISVLSSSFPIVVNFSVTVARQHHFPYGKPTPPNGKLLVATFALGITVIGCYMTMRPKSLLD